MAGGKTVHSFVIPMTSGATFGAKVTGVPEQDAETEEAAAARLSTSLRGLAVVGE